MKKILLPILFVAMFVFTFGQTELFLGPSAGLNINAIRSAGGGFGSSRSKINLGYTVGAPFEVRFTDIIALQTGLFYARRGGKENATGFRLDLDQLEIPLFVKVGYGQNRKWQVYGIAGLKIGVGLKGTYSNPTFNFKTDVPYGGSFGLKRGYIGLATGFGGSVQLGPGKLVVDYFYDVAMSKVYRGEFVVLGDVTRRQSNNNFSVGYLFLLNGKGE